MYDNLLEIAKTNSDCAKYTGTVTIASYLGDRLIQQETCHNAGLKPLFEFIGSCLQGNWYEARDKRPCKLVMLTADKELEKFEGDNKSTPTNINAIDSQGDHYWSSKYEVCSPIMYDSAVISTTTTTGSSTTYHFRVPFLSLVGGSTIKKLMLLPPVATKYQTDACAYFILENGIQVPAAAANYTVIMDWTLEFTNSSAN
jgi:hypothetical protein